MWGSVPRPIAKPPGSRIRDALKPIAEHHAVADLWVEKIPEDMRATSPCLKAGKGCAKCCEQMAMVTIPEAMYVLWDVVQLYKSTEWLRDEGLAEIQRQKALSAEPGMSNVEWFKRGIKCVFLDKENTCRVYERRPTVCRSYYVVDGEPEQCVEPERKVKMVDTRDLEKLTAEASLKVARELRIDPRPLPLAVALDWALVGYAEGLGELRRRLKTGLRVEASIGDDGTITNEV